MGYESRVYVVKPYSETYGDVVAMFDLCKMGDDMYYGKTFPGLFTVEKDSNYKFYADDGETVINEDPYRDIVKRPENNRDVLRWLKEFCKSDTYWRAKVFKDFLASIEKTGEDYELYHFGY